ncbi:MAG: leucyl aminopeptidase [Terrimesophilobacter sp.]
MTVAALHLSSERPLDINADVLVLGVTSSDAGPTLLIDDPEFDGIKASLKALGVTGSEDEIRRLAPPTGSAKCVTLIGLGSAEVTPNVLRRAAGSATRQLTSVGSLTFALPTSSPDDVLAVLEGAAIGSYSFTRYRSQAKEAAKVPASDITVVTDVPGVDDLPVRAAIIADAIHNVRDLVNMPPLDLYPESFATAAHDLAEGAPVTVTVLGDKELAEGGYGGIIGVGQGSTRSPRLVKVEYSPTGATKHIALVGKGITFDSGGLSLKPGSSMAGMKYDMTGAATVLGVALAVARLGLGVRMTAWLCIAENMPSGSAIRPNDVLTIRGGKTVEVLNTDAEGRLVLADGLVAAGEENPDMIIDVATLTGAARVALGDRYVGTMGDESLVADVVNVATRVGESMWAMPLPSELRALLNSDVADIANVKIGSSAAGMLVAAVFLQEFVGKSENGSRIPWAHLDIAGPANNDGSGYGYTGKGPTGVSVRTLIALAEQVSRS